MSRLDAKIADWVTAGLIAEPQGAAIRAFEAARPGGNWLFYSFLALAGSVIGLGVIALVATNWEAIPNEVKLGCDFALLILLALGVWHGRETTREVAAELALLLFLLFCLASIGLISQIYHTGGELYQATLFWSLITLPAATLARRFFVPELWVTVALWSVVWSVVDKAWGPLFDDSPELWLSVLFSLPLFCALAAHLLRDVAGAEGFVSGFRRWVLLGGLVAVVSIDLATWEHDRDLSPSLLFLGLPLALLLLAGVLGSALPPMRRLLITAQLGLYTLLYLLVVLTPVGSWVTALLVIALLGFAAMDAAARDERRRANLMVLLMGLRFLVLYLDAVGGLAYTGFGLILTGVLLLAMLMLWRRYQARLLHWMARVAA